MKRLFCLFLLIFTGCITEPVVKNDMTLIVDNTNGAQIDSIWWGYYFGKDSSGFLRERTIAYEDAEKFLTQYKISVVIESKENEYVHFEHKVYSNGFVLNNKAFEFSWGANEAEKEVSGVYDSTMSKIIQKYQEFDNTSASDNQDSLLFMAHIEILKDLDSQYVTPQNYSNIQYANKLDSAFVNYAYQTDLDLTSFKNAVNIPFLPYQVDSVAIQQYDSTDSSFSSDDLQMVKVVQQDKDDFWINRFEITTKLWNKVLAEQKADAKIGMNIVPSDLNTKLPVHNVSIYQAMKFCDMLSNFNGKTKYYNIGTLKRGIIIENEKEDTIYFYDIDSLKAKIEPSANGYRLPTLEEWELAYSKNVSDQSRFYWGALDTKEYISKFANIGTALIAPGSKKPNARGLWDMNGNVAEWVQQFPENSGLGKEARFIFKGGGYSNHEDYLQFEKTSLPNIIAKGYETLNYVGFRVVGVEE